MPEQWKNSGKLAIRWLFSRLIPATSPMASNSVTNRCGIYGTAFFQRSSSPIKRFFFSVIICWTDAICKKALSEMISSFISSPCCRPISSGEPARKTTGILPSRSIRMPFPLQRSAAISTSTQHNNDKRKMFRMNPSVIFSGCFLSAPFHRNQPVERIYDAMTCT